MKQGVSVAGQPGLCKADPGWNTRFKRYAFAEELSDDLREIFRDAESLLMRSDLVKNSRSTTAGIFAVEGRKFFIKRSNVNSFFERVRRIGRMPRSVRNAVIAEKLASNGILTPRVYMSLTTGAPWLPAASYLITEYFPEPMAAVHFMSKDTVSEGRERFIEPIAGMIRKMHSCGVAHGDLKMGNILCIAANGKDYEFGVFDLDGSEQFDHSCPVGAQIKDLARVSASYCFYLLYKDLMKSADIGQLRNMWCQAYADAGGCDYRANKEFLYRFDKFLPEKMIRRMREK